MKKVMVYGSQYGTAKRYAEELSKRTGIPAVSYKENPDLSGCKTLIYLGGLYAGGILGLAQTLKRLPSGHSVDLLLATVGLSDPKAKSNTDAIAQSAKKQLPAELFERTRLFHLRGGIDYSRLSYLHRIMMRMMYTMDKKRPPEQQTEESREMVATYGKKVDFVQLDSLGELENAIG